MVGNSINTETGAGLGGWLGPDEFVMMMHGPGFWAVDLLHP